MKDVTIGVLTWNSLDMLKMFFDYLEKYTPKGYQTIVINNGSTDGTKEYLDKKKDVVSIHNETNLGVIKALEQTEKLVKTKYLLSINDDILVSKNWLSELIKVYESDENIKIVAPFKPGTKINYPYSKKSSRLEWENLQIKNPSLDKSELIKRFTNNDFEQFVTDIKKVNNFGNRYLECPFDFLSGCCLLVESKFMSQIGGFVDNRFDVYGSEDVDRCWRIGTRGYSVVQTSNVFVHHFEGVSLKNNRLKWKQLVKKNNKKLMSKWHNEFWSLLSKKLEDSGNIDNVVSNHWIVEWLLESVDRKSIPQALRPEVMKFLDSHTPKLS